jgi:large subunit ribosomal protein L13
VSTYTPKPGEVTREWHVIDANDVVLGRLASQAATLLRGKHKPQFANHLDTGDFVIIVNAEKIAVSPSKLGELRYRHSGYPGGLSKRTVGELLDSKPERLVELAVKGMLPKNTLGRKQLKKLKVYAGPEHPHQAQQPSPLSPADTAQAS